MHFNLWKASKQDACFSLAGIICQLLIAGPHLSLAQNKRPYSWVSTYHIGDMKIKLSVIYEGEVTTDQGQRLKYYSISWQDTLGQKPKDASYNRPIELHAIAYDKESLVGRYTGLSTSFTHCNVLTNRKTIRLHLYPAKNPFYDPGSSMDTTSSSSKHFARISLKPMFEPYLGEFAPIHINLQRFVQNVIDGYEERAIILQKNPEIVALYHVNKNALNPDPMPRHGPLYCKLMALNRWYVNLDDGKILKGSQWIRRKGIKTCCQLSLSIIHPDRWYELKDGRRVKGQSLIKKRYIALESIKDKSQFRNLELSWPY